MFVGREPGGLWRRRRRLLDEQLIVGEEEKARKTTRSRQVCRRICHNHHIDDKTDPLSE
jgi:hypothetical protein